MKLTLSVVFWLAFFGPFSIAENVFERATQNPITLSFSLLRGWFKYNSPQINTRQNARANIHRCQILLSSESGMLTVQVRVEDAAGPFRPIVMNWMFTIPSPIIPQVIQGTDGYQTSGLFTDRFMTLDPYRPYSLLRTEDVRMQGNWLVFQRNNVSSNVERNWFEWYTFHLQLSPDQTTISSIDFRIHNQRDESERRVYTSFSCSAPQ